MAAPNGIPPKKKDEAMLRKPLPRKKPAFNITVRDVTLDTSQASRNKNKTRKTTLSNEQSEEELLTGDQEADRVKLTAGSEAVAKPWAEQIRYGDQASPATAQSLASAPGAAHRTKTETAPGTTQGTTPGTKPGTKSGTAPGTAPRTTQGTTPGTKSGIVSGTTPGITPGTAPGTTPGPKPGTKSGTAPGTAPRTTPETKTETTPGPKPGTNAGKAPGTAPRTTPGTKTETAPGTTNGTTPATTPATTPGTAIGITPGTAPGTVPGTTPGITPGTAPLPQIRSVQKSEISIPRSKSPILVKPKPTQPQRQEQEILNLLPVQQQQQQQQEQKEEQIESPPIQARSKKQEKFKNSESDQQVQQMEQQQQQNQVEKEKQHQKTTKSPADQKSPSPPHPPQRRKSRRHWPCCCCHRTTNEDDDTTKVDIEGQGLEQPAGGSSQKREDDASHIAALHAESRVKQPARSGQCCRKFVTFLLSHIGISALVVAYSIMGGFLFRYLEFDDELQDRERVYLARSQTVMKLWNLTQELNILYEKNWTQMADDTLRRFQLEVYEATINDGWDGRDIDTNMKWSFAGSLLYCITVITTIGYGHITPQTDMGKLATIFYALVGIPLTLLCLSNIGTVFANCFRFLYYHLCRCLHCKCNRSDATPQTGNSSRSSNNRPPPAYNSVRGEGNTTHGTGSGRPLLQDPEDPVAVQSLKVVVSDSRLRKDVNKKQLRRPESKENFSMSEVRVPVTISLLIMALYIFGGAVLFTLWEKDWNYLIGAYFCFITLSTIGFGDYVFGGGGDFDGSEKTIICAVYLVLGLSIIAMCFNLMQEEVKAKSRWLAAKIGILEEES